MSTAGERFVPAAGRASLTRGYDLVLGLTMREGSWRPVLAERVLADLPAGRRSLMSARAPARRRSTWPLRDRTSR